MKARILVVDDDASIRETFVQHLGESGHEVAACADVERALAQLATLDPTLIITDVRMPGQSGLVMLERVKSTRPDIDVVVMTAHEDMSTAIQAMRHGAYDYLVKPLDLDHIDRIVARCVRDRASRRGAQRLVGDAAPPFRLDRMVGRNPAMIATYKLIGQLAATRTPVLVHGETGTGKELVARAIHFNSPGSDEPFVALNCTAIAETLLESELFGHVRGAFTGAVADRKGQFELAASGTLFLDEIGDTSLVFQSKLLRVLQEREYSPVGGERVRRTDARVIAATNRSLADAVTAGRFRADLYYRLRVVEINIPPLRNRKDDIPLLVEHIVARVCREMQRQPAAVSRPALDTLIAYDWPGNVRELENTITRAMVLARGGVIGPEHLSLGLQGSAGSTESSPHDESPKDESLEGVEREHVRRVYQHAAFNKRQTALRLGISRPTLDRLIERYGLHGPGN